MLSFIFFHTITSSLISRIFFRFAVLISLQTHTILLCFSVPFQNLAPSRGSKLEKLLLFVYFWKLIHPQEYFIIDTRDIRAPWKFNRLANSSNQPISSIEEIQCPKLWKWADDEWSVDTNRDCSGEG